MALLNSRCIWFALSLACSTAFAQQATPVAAGSKTYSDPLEIKADFLDRANQATQDGKLLDASAFFLAASQMGGLSALDSYNCACVFSLLGLSDQAFGFLESSIRAGYRNATHIAMDPDLSSLRKLDRWKPTLELISKLNAEDERRLKDPKSAKWVTEDIDRYWAAYDRSKGKSEAEQIEIFSQLYIRPGTDGLADFFSVRRGTAKRLVAFANKSPNYLADIREFSLKIKSLAPSMTKVYENYKKFYPESRFPHVYWCIGGYWGGGTVSTRGLLMSADMYGPPSARTSELGSWEQSVYTDTEAIVAIVAHELAHFQQKNTVTNLLGSCLNEGGASFIGTLASGYLSKREAKIFAWGDAHEAELWKEFAAEMDGKKTTNWLYSGSGKGERPVDLGYWMGYKICKAYYDKMADKKQAVYDILHITDAKKFLEKSGYNGGAKVQL